MHRRKIVVRKMPSTATDTFTDLTESLNNEETDTEMQTDEQNQFQSIVNVSYKKPPGGSKQDNMTTDDIRDKLKGFVALKSMNDKKILSTLPLFKTWVRYINNETKQFRSGGLLMKVVYPDYIMLVNTRKNLTWSVQLRDNIIFIRDPEQENERIQEKNKERLVKEKLYDMYLNGQLQKK
jgi:hypothetical protein